MEHIGIDVHKNASQLCIRTEAGQPLERRVRTDRQSFAKLLGQRPKSRILIESSTESEWVARCLEELEHEVAKRLCTAAGVGPVTALSFVATVDHVERFAHA